MANKELYMKMNSSTLVELLTVYCDVIDVYYDVIDVYYDVIKVCRKV